MGRKFNMKNSNRHTNSFHSASDYYLNNQNNLIESNTIDYGPSRKDLNHNFVGADLNQHVELLRVDTETKVLPYYRSSVFHLDDKKGVDNTIEAKIYSTSVAPLKHLRYRLVVCKTGPSRKDLNHNLKGTGLNVCPVEGELTPEIGFTKVVTPFYRSSVFHLDDKNGGDNTVEAKIYSTSDAPLKHLRYRLVVCKTGPSQKDLNHNSRFSRILKFIGIFSLLIVLLGCGSSEDSGDHQNHTANDDSTFTTGTHQPHQHDFTEPVETAEGDTVWACSMHPNVRQSEPGNCPICGMDLVPVPTESSGNDKQLEMDVINDQRTVQLSPQAAALAQVETSPVVRQKAVKKVRLPGKIEVDERLISSVTAHFPGRIIDLFVDYTGQYIKQGERLATIYSPELVTAQKEFFEAIKFKQSNPQLYNAARRKLELWELPENEIREIENSQSIRNEVGIVSPVSGYVLQRNIARQDHVMEGTVMYKVADLHQVWLILDAYEQDATGLTEGDSIHFEVKAHRGKTIMAEISFIGPVVESQKRTVRVRAVVENKKRDLKPGMLAHGIVKSELYQGEPVLQVPKSAVLWTGKRSLVYVQHGDRPHYEAREVELGMAAGDRYVILQGLKEGENVVTRGTFKIDSAAQLQGNFSMMNRSKEVQQNSAGGSHRH